MERQKIAKAEAWANEKKLRGQARTLPELIALGKKLNKSNPHGWAWNIANARKLKH
jgi:hypothetical protein